MMDIGSWIALGFFLVGGASMVIGDRRLTQAKRLFDAATEDRRAVTRAFHLAKAGCWEEAQQILSEAEAAERVAREDVA